MMTGAVMGLTSQFLQMLPEFFTNAQPMSTAGTLTLTTTGPTLNQWYILTIVALPMLGGILFAVGFVGYVVRKTINKTPPDKRLRDDAQ